MQKLLVALLFYCCCISGYGQRGDTVRRYLNDRLIFTTKNKGDYAAVSIKTETHWMLFAVYSDTNTLLRAYFKDRDLRIRDGRFTLYHPKNIKAVEGIFVNNIRQGIWKYWYPNGQLKDSGMIKNNQMVNSWYSWHETGQLQSIANYFPIDSVNEQSIIVANSKSGGNQGVLDADTVVNYPHGNWQSYHANGLPKDSGLYVHSVRQGEWKTWYVHGTLESKGNYVNGVMEGDWEYYHENGQTSTKEKYRKNKITEMHCYDSNGVSMGDFCSVLKPAVPILERHVTFQSYILDNVFWPKELDGKNVNGTVKAEYTISKQGKLTGIKILTTPHELLGKEIERFLRSLENWSPATSHNRIIDFTGILEVPFFR